MKYPKFIACIAHYHNIDPNITTARSLIISKLKNNQIIKSYFSFVNIDTDDDICQDIDQIVKYFQDDGNDTDVKCTVTYEGKTAYCTFTLKHYGKSVKFN